MRRGRFSVWLYKMTGLSSVSSLVGVNSKCGVQSKRRCESHESLVQIVSVHSLPTPVFSKNSMCIWLTPFFIPNDDYILPVPVFIQIVYILPAPVFSKKQSVHLAYSSL